MGAQKSPTSITCLCRNVATYEGNEEWCQGHVKRCFGSSVGRGAWFEEEGLRDDDQQFGTDRHERCEGHRQVCYPRCLPDQNTCEASHKSWEEDDLWQRGHRQGQASQDSCEGIPCGCAQEEHLSMSMVSSFEKCSPWESRGAVS